MRIIMPPATGNDNLDGWLRKLVTSLGRMIDATLAYNTSNVNPRITIGTDGIIAYDSGGNKYFSLDAATATCQSMVLSKDAANITLDLSVSSSNTAHSGALVFKRAAGTLASPTAVPSGVRIMQICVDGYLTAAYEGAKRTIGAESTEIWSATAAGFSLSFYTRPNGTIGAATERLQITHDGNSKFLGTILAGADGGGVATTVGFSNVSDLTSRSTGIGTILFDDSTDRSSAGFIKIYVGTTAYYVPVFAAIT